MPQTSAPKYPVVDPSPSLEKLVGNFNVRDLCNVGGFAASGYVVGFFSGKPAGTFLAFW
jgi:hypothetical protein